MSTVKKVTKKEVLEAVVKLLRTENGNANVGDTSISVDEAVEVVEGMILQLDRKAEQARERAAKKKAEGDELRDIAEGVFISSRSVAGSMRKLVNDGYVDKLSGEPAIYSLTNKGKEVKLDI